MGKLSSGGSFKNRYPKGVCVFFASNSAFAKGSSPFVSHSVSRSALIPSFLARADSSNPARSRAHRKT